MVFCCHYLFYLFHFLLKREPSSSPSKQKYFKGKKIFLMHKTIFLTYKSLLGYNISGIYRYQEFFYFHK